MCFERSVGGLANLLEADLVDSPRDLLRSRSDVLRDRLRNPPTKLLSVVAFLWSKVGSGPGLIGKRGTHVAYSSLLRVLHRVDDRSALRSRVCPWEEWTQAVEASGGVADTQEKEYRDVDFGAWTHLALPFWKAKAAAGRVHHHVLQQEYAVKNLVRGDFERAAERISEDANVCAENGDARGVSQCRRRLVGSGGMALASVRLANGQLSRSETERRKRWSQHFTEVYAGRVEELSSILGD